MKNGRNGLDSLAFFSIVMAIVFFALASVLEEYYVLIPALIGAGFIAYALFRILSLNTAKRRYEADKFTSLFKKDPYRKFKCPKCATLCRVPRGRGKIKIHCPKCGEEFIKRS